MARSTPTKWTAWALANFLWMMRTSPVLLSFARTWGIAIETIRSINGHGAYVLSTANPFPFRRWQPVAGVGRAARGGGVDLADVDHSPRVSLTSRGTRMRFAKCLRVLKKIARGHGVHARSRSGRRMRSSSRDPVVCMGECIVRGRLILILARERPDLLSRVIPFISRRNCGSANVCQWFCRKSQGDLEVDGPPGGGGSEWNRLGRRGPPSVAGPGKSSVSSGKMGGSIDVFARFPTLWRWVSRSGTAQCKHAGANGAWDAGCWRAVTTIPDSDYFGA